MSACPPDSQDPAPRLGQLRSGIGRIVEAMPRRPVARRAFTDGPLGIERTGATGVEVRSPRAVGFDPAPIHREGPPAGGPAPT